MAEVERNEILVADDEEEIRRGVVEAVREIFPDLNIHEATLAHEALRALHLFGDRLFLVISDGEMGGNTNAGTMVTNSAHEKGIPNIAYHSSAANVMRRKLEPSGTKCIQKEPGNTTLKQWLRDIRHS